MLVNTLLDQAQPNSGATKVRFVANDGYAVEAPLADIRACADCLVAFTDTPEDFQLVMPAFESSLWVKGLVQISIE